MNVWVWGAGRLGRGFLAPCFCNHLIRFIDTDVNLLYRLRNSQQYSIYFGARWGWGFRSFGPYALELVSKAKDLEKPDLVLLAVGPKYVDAASDVQEAIGDVPLITFENDPRAAEALRCLGVNAFSGIASVTIPQTYRIEDWGRLTLLGDIYGTLQLPKTFVQSYPQLVPQLWNPRPFPYDVEVYEDHQRAWDKKYLIHLAPHALCAYLGISGGQETIGEVLRAYEYEIDDAMQPVLQWLEQRYSDENWQSNWGAEKRRLLQPHLEDSVWRVGRNPHIKVQSCERLVRALLINETSHLWRQALGTALSFTQDPEKRIDILPLPEATKEIILQFSLNTPLPPVWAEELYKCPT